MSRQMEGFARARRHTPEPQRSTALTAAIQVMVTPEFRERVNQLAHRRFQKTSEMVRELLEAAVEAAEQEG